MGKTRDLFKKTRDAKGTFHAKMGTIKDREPYCSFLSRIMEDHVQLGMTPLFSVTIVSEMS